MREEETERGRGGSGRGPEHAGGRAAGDASAGGRWVLGTLLAALGLALALGLAWYVAEGYRQAGGEGGEAGEAAPAGDAAARPGTASTAEGRLRARRRTGSGRWLSIRAPVVSFPTLEGDTASLAGRRGEVVVLNFWATWCPPCKREIPELSRLQDSLRSEPSTVVGIAVSSGSRQEIRSFGEEYGINYPVWLSDPGTAATEYRAVGLPTTLLVDGRGIIRRRYVGPQSYETLSEDVRALLDSASALPGSGASDTTAPRPGPGTR